MQHFIDQQESIEIDFRCCPAKGSVLYHNGSKNMKKAVIITALTAITSSAAMAEDPKRMSVEMNPLGVAFGIWNGTFLYDATDKISVGPEASYFGLDLLSTEFGIGEYGLRVEYRPGGADKSGLYVAATPSYNRVAVTVTDSGESCTGSTSGFGLDSTVGYKWISEGGFVSRLGAGYKAGSYSELKAKCDDGSEASEVADLPYGGLSLEWSLGYKF